MNWIYLIGAIGIISGIISSARNRANQRQQNNIAAGVLKAQQIQEAQRRRAQQAQRQPRRSGLPRRTTRARFSGRKGDGMRRLPRKRIVIAADLLVVVAGLAVAGAVRYETGPTYCAVVHGNFPMGNWHLTWPRCSFRQRLDHDGA